ncbi:FliH/SctL family protein [Thermosulfuriphilus sp.]
MIKGRHEIEVTPIELPETEAETFASLVALVKEPAQKDLPQRPKETSQIQEEPSPEPSSSRPGPEPPKEEKREPEPDIEEIINQRVIERLAERLAQVEQDAYEKGFAQGEKDGRELGLRQYESVAKRLEALLKALEREREALLEKYQKELVALVKAVAERIIFREVEQHPEVIFTCLKEALALAVEKAKVIIRVNPQDLELLDKASEEVSVDLARFEKVDFRPDPGISRGGCLLETDFGLIDATLEHRRDELFKAIDQALEEDGDGSQSSS